MTSTAVALAGLLSLLICTPPDARGQWPGELHGRVLDVDTGIGLAGVHVSVDAADRSVRTQGDGSFRLRSLEPGPVHLEFRRTGYTPVDTTLVVRPGVSSALLVQLAPMAARLAPVSVTVPRSSGARAFGARVLEGAAIRASGAGSLGEVVADFPGLTLVERGPGGEQTVIVRGAAADQLLVLVDGTPLNDPVTGRVDLGTVPIERVRRIEYQPGAGSAREGRGALAGVLEITTDGVAESLDASLAVGSLGERRASVGGSMPIGSARASVRIRALGLDGKFPFERDERVGGGMGVRENADRSEVGAEVRLGTDEIAGASEWELVLQADEMERGIPGKSYAPSRHARQGVGQGSVRFRFERGLGVEEAGGGSPAPRLLVRTGLSERRLHFWDPQPPIGPAFDDRSRLRTIDVSAEVEGRADPARRFRRFRWSAGADVRTMQLQSDLLSEDRGGDRSLDAGAFVHLERQMPDRPLHPRLRLSARLDRSDEGPVVSHEIAIGVSPGSVVSVDLAHRSAWASPSPADQFFQDGVGVEPNPDLRGERVPDELEVAVATPLRLGSSRLELTASAYRSDIRDHIVWAPDFRFVWSPRNVDVRRRGWSVGGVLALEGGLRMAAELSDVNIRYVGRDGRPGSQVAYRPRRSASVSLAWSPGPWNLNLTSIHTGARFPVPAPVNELPGFWTTSAAVSATVDVRGWRVEPRLRIRRLADERAPFIFSVPEAGRTLRFEVRVGPGP